MAAMSLRVVSLAAVLLTGLVLPGWASADAARAEGFAAHFHRDDTTVIVVEDPLPHLRTLLNSPALRRLFGDGPLAKLFSREEQPINPAEGWLWVNTNRRWIPQQVAIGLSDAGAADCDHLLRLAALFELHQTASRGEPDDAKLREEVKSLRKSVAEVLPLIQLPRMRIYVRFRDGEDANALLEIVRLLVHDLPKEDVPPGVTFENKGTALVARFVLDDMLRAGDIHLETLLTEMGVVHIDDGAAALKKSIDAVRAFKAEITLEQVGTGLLLTVGPISAGGPVGLPAEFVNLPEAVGKPDAHTMIWGRWSAARLKSAAAAWMTLHEKWKPSRAHRLAGERPMTATEPLIDTLHDLAIRIRKFSDAGTLRVFADENSPAIRLAMQEEPKPAAADLVGSALAKLLPADVDGVSVETDTSLGEVVSDWVMQVEDRLATQSLKADLRGKDNDPVHRVEQDYYSHFADLRTLLHRAALDKFEPGYAVLFGTKGKVARFEASFEFKALSQRLSGRDLPTPELALIGKPKGGEATMREHADKVYSAMIRGIRSASRPDAFADQPLPAVDVKSVAVDLDLGVPTWTFDSAALTKASGEAKLRLDIAGDLRPHFFFVDGLVVFSTSARLSKSILAAHSGKGKRLILPEDDGELVAIGRQSGESFGKTFEHLKAWYHVLANQQDAGGDDDDRTTLMFDAMAALSRGIQKVEWTTVQPTGEKKQITEGIMIFSEPK